MENIIDTICFNIKKKYPNIESGWDLYINDDELNLNQVKIKFDETVITNLIYHFLLFCNTNNGIMQKTVLFKLSKSKILLLWKKGLILMKMFFTPYILGRQNICLNQLKKNDSLIMKLIKYYIKYKYNENVSNNDIKKKFAVICDGWTLKTETIKNFAATYKIWSEKDHYYALRFLILSTIQGQYLDVKGVFFTNIANSDNNCYDKLMSHNIDNFAKHYGPSKCWFFVDRAWRFSKLLHLNNLITPAHPSGTLSEIDANLSRLCTMIRWKIEIKIGEVQTKFLFLQKTIHFRYLIYISDIVKSMISIIKFCKKKTL